MPQDLPFVVPFALLLAVSSSILGAIFYRSLRRRAKRAEGEAIRRHRMMAVPYKPQTYPPFARKLALTGAVLATFLFGFIEFMVHQQSGRVTFFIPLWVFALYMTWQGVYRMWTMRVLVTPSDITVFQGVKPEIILTKENITFAKLDPQYQRHLSIRTNAGQKVRLDRFVFDLGEWESDLLGFALHCAQQRRRR